MRITKFTVKSDEIIWEGSQQLSSKPTFDTFLNGVTLPDKNDYELIFVWTHGDFNTICYSIYDFDSSRITLSAISQDGPYKLEYDFIDGRYIYTGHPYEDNNELHYEAINLSNGLNSHTVSNDEVVRKIILRRTTNHDNTII